MKMMMNGKFLRTYLGKWRKMGTKVFPSTICDHCGWALWACLHKEDSIPKDVPKGHLVVYVGEEYQRFVIKVGLLNHPLFKALLDQAQEEYQFSPDSKLCIPCNQHIFLSVLRCANSPRDQRISLCL